MRYVCTVCGYVYDDAAESVPFAELPDDWICPLCRAPKSAFEPEQAAEPVASPATAPAVPVFDDDLQKLTAGQLAAIFSNLARGSEKQYKDEEAGLFSEIAAYFTAATPASEIASIDELAKMLEGDIREGYPLARSTAKAEGDRGAQRICVWGEKVSRMLASLLDRYRAEGEKMLEGAEVWVCTICGFVYIGEQPPELCPICKVPPWKFEKVEGRRSA
ncbi:MAG: rubredoxin [bacterium]|nr:rubredoxin [bacterium]